MPLPLSQSIRRRIRVFIVDDHALVRAGLKLFLSAFDDLQLVGEATHGEEATLLCAELYPDVVLMDLQMPGMGGVEAIRLIRQHCPKVQLIALMNFGEENLQLQAMEVGACSYLLKNISADRLAEAIRAAYAGRPGSEAPAARV